MHAADSTNKSTSESKLVGIDPKLQTKSTDNSISKTTGISASIRYGKFFSWLLVLTHQNVIREIDI